MKVIICSICIFLGASVFGQISAQCRIEIYLVKNSINPSRPYNFTATKEDLEETAFISDQEIIMYSFEKFKTKRRYKCIRRVRRIHTIKTSISIDNDSLQRTGSRKFVLMLNNEIVYWGYLSSTLSSVVPDSKVDARLSDFEFELNYSSSTSELNNDPRENKSLFNCLKQSNRFIYSTKQNGR